MKTCRDIINKRRQLWDLHQNIEQDKAYREAIAKYMMEHEHIRKEIQDYPEHLIEMCFVIVDKDKKTSPFFLNEVQRDFCNRLNQARADYKAGTRINIKFLILKGRQQGFTSLITAYQLANTITRKNFEGFTAADEDTNSSTIFENKAKYPYTALPEQIKPTEKYNNRKQLLFEKLHSSWEVKTASKNMGRSRTINFFHGSEVAFWKDGISGVQAGLGEALTKDAIQIYESTANGYNEYKELWDSDKWENCFYEWWRTEEYRTSFENDHKRLWFVEQVDIGTEWIWERCRWLKGKNLDGEQIYWYYNKWYGYIDSSLIKQEYPCTAEEAFLATGECVFNQESIVARIDELEQLHKTEKPIRGSFTFDYVNEQIVEKSIKFNPDDNGPVTIYEYPEPRVPYVIGGDTAEGGIDYSAGDVTNNITGNQAAVWHGKTDTDLFAKQMYCVGKFYNNALIAIEVNFDRHPVKELTRLRYHRQFKREMIDKITKQKQYGFLTSSITRPVIIDELKIIVRDHIHLINDIPTLREMLTFIINDNGRQEAMAGKHDDLVMCKAIAFNARSQQRMTLSEEYVEESDYAVIFGRTGY
jgi:hypothetical protein